jgi:hypothetical protein
VNNYDRAILYLIAAMVGRSIGMAEWGVYLAAMTAVFFMLRAVAQVVEAILVQSKGETV